VSAFPRQFPRRGEVYWVDFGAGEGSEQQGQRPAVVVSNDVNNQHSTVVLVAAITSKIPAKPYPHTVFLPAGPLREDGTILCNQIRTMAKNRLKRCQGDLDEQRLEELDRALVISLGLPRG
jgi:mRNA interferase MazF